MKINGASIIKSLVIITVLFITFVFAAYLIKNIDMKDNDSKKSLSLKSVDNLNIKLNNTLPLSDKLAIDNEKSSISDEIFKNIKFELVNNSSDDLDYEIYITKNEIKENEIEGKYIKFYLVKTNEVNLSKNKDIKVPTYDDLYVIDDLPGSRILYRGNIDGDSTEEFDFKTWISDNYSNNSKVEEFNYSIHVRVMED